MTSKFLSIASLVAAAAIVASPAVQASVVSDFKAELKKITSTKKNAGAAKAAAKLIGKYVDAKKGDPKKYFNFTKLAQNGIKKVTDDKSKGQWAQFWSKFTVFNYFKKGLKVNTYNVNDKNYKKSFDFVFKKLPKSQKTQSVVQKAFNELKKANQKLGNSSATLGLIQEQVAADTGITPVS